MNKLFLVLLFVCLAATAGGPVEATDKEHEILPAGEAYQSASIYEGGWELTDQDGAKAPLDIFKGNPVVITMFYSSCSYSCPLLIESIKSKIERALPDSIRKDLRVLLITFDPARDTPEKLKRLAADKSIDLTRWKLLTAKEGVVRDIAAVLGVKYRQVPGGDFNHSSIIALLNADGVITARVDGLNQPMDPIVERLQVRK